MKRLRPFSIFLAVFVSCGFSYAQPSALFSPEISATVSEAALAFEAPLAFTENLEKTSFRRGTNYTLRWTGGSQDDRLKLEVFQTGNSDPVLVQVINQDFINEGETTFTLDKKLKPGKNYYYRLSSVKNPEQTIQSEPSTVKRRIPLWVKIAVPVAIVAVIIVTAGKGSSAPSTDGVIVDPPRPGS